MGQQHPSPNPNPSHPSHLTDRFTIQSQLPDTNCLIVRQRSTSLHYLLKQHSLTSSDQFNRLITTLTHRKQLRNEHYFHLQDFLVRTETSFCSNFHKITTIYEYSQHCLKSEVEARRAEGKRFEEKEIWSILCSCCLAIAYLTRSGVEVRVMSTREIFLTVEGIVKVADPEMFSLGGFGKNWGQYYSPEYLTYHRQSPSSCVFSLGMCLLEFMFMQDLKDCYDLQEYRFNDAVFSTKIAQMMKMTEYSEGLKQVLIKMLNTSEKHRPTMLQLDQHLIQVVDTPGSTSQLPSATKYKPSTSVVQQKQQTQPEVQSQILSMPINPSNCEPAEHTSETPEMLDIDVECPDEADDAKSESGMTERSSGQSQLQLQPQHQSSQCKKMNNMMMGRQNNNVSTFQAEVNKEEVGRTASNSGFNNRVLMASYPDNINAISISEKKTTTSFVKSTVMVRPDTDDLFTKPEILMMVRHQLQEINMRKSKLRQYQPTKQYPVTQQIPSRASIQLQRPRSDKQNSSSSFHLITNVNYVKSIQTSHARIQQQLTTIIPSVPFLPSVPSCVPPPAPTTQQPQSLPLPLSYVTETYSKGKYQGQKRGNLRHGYGTFHYKQGGKYTGEWLDNKMSGKGILYYFNDKIAYDGEWKDDRLWGRGVLYNEDPKTLKGSYNYASWDDVDEFWVRYEGGFVDDNKDGSGKLYLSNGEVFQGNFRNDEVNGEGVFYRVDGKVVRGMWKGNQLVQQY